jgi:uncharacterized membrane protein YfcA
LGIGGGFLYVPALVYLMKFPVHVATATSLFVLAITSLTGSVTHFAAGLFDHGFRQAIGLSIGAIVGADRGATVAPYSAIGSSEVSPWPWQWWDCVWSF